MASRTTIVLDAPSRKAAKSLSARWGCSSSEAIRRALVAQRDAVFGISQSERNEKRRALLRLFEAFEGTDAAAEIARRKAEDAYF